MTVYSPAFTSPVVRLDQVDSTNAEGMRRASAGERGPLWIVADRQTAGRGRSGRSWTQIQGNLAASLLFVPACPPANLHHLALLTGVATHDAIERTSGGSVPGLRLKWPNDILVGAAKAGGILVETTTFGGTMIAIAGIGVNVASAPPLGDRPVARLGDFAEAVTVEQLLGALDDAMRYWLGVWQGGVGFAQIRAAWLARSGPEGEPLTVNTGRERLGGTFHGIDDGGALLLRTDDGSLRRLTYGDVSLAGAVGSPPKGRE